MAQTKLKKQQTQELSRKDHGKLMAQALIEGMIQNPDSILNQQAGGRLEVYKDLLRDDQVASTFQQRRRATVTSEWEVEPASDSAEDKQIADFVKTNLQNIGFDELTNKMLYAIHYGYAVGEIMWKYSEQQKGIVIDRIKVRDRARFRFGIRDELMLLHKDITPQEMPRDKFWVFSVGADHDDNPYGEGLAHALYWPVFFKRNGIKFWMVHLEKFGMPTATAKLTQAQMNDPEKVGLALSVLDAIQADSGVVVPEDFVVELIEASRSGTADYNTLKSAMDAAISKIVLSQTMTTDDGSSQSQATVHKGVRDEVVKSDADLLCASFNEQVVKQLVEINFPGKPAPKVWRRTEPQEDLVQVAERDNKIMALGFEPTEEYIQETYGPGWRKKEEKVPPVTAPGQAPGQGPIPELGPEFAEVSPLTDKRVQHRRDQQALVDAAEALATKYASVYGKRIEQLLAYLEETGDPETFKKRIYEMMAEPAPQEAVEFVEKATWTSKLMGLFKGKRK